jgi:hypothetical protein
VPESARGVTPALELTRSAVPDRSLAEVTERRRRSVVVERVQLLDVALCRGSLGDGDGVGAAGIDEERPKRVVEGLTSPFGLERNAGRDRIEMGRFWRVTEPLLIASPKVRLMPWLLY